MDLNLMKDIITNGGVIFSCLASIWAFVRSSKQLQVDKLDKLSDSVNDIRQHFMEHVAEEEGRLATIEEKTDHNSRSIEKQLDLILKELTR
jgi:hypothetical protein